ncbi:PQ-loop domain-containing transporter [Mycoplasmopsis bovis]|uniref:PQ loop repeat protein n=1 Tax=Mycoplasmopsis bovis TaxID=28903 RepID=A0A2N8U1E1_MYCBV|nr:PQ-loop domain-containing transporter [Mycoplasmopsis bovis]SBO45831.1 PQ loop repeat protein [Mycoplasmopsis bovis]
MNIDAIYSTFFVNGSNVISAWFVIIFGFLGMSMTLILGLPQAIHLYKCKKTGNVKYYSYWMFLFGILSWIFLGAFDPVQKMFAIVISNCICSLIYVITLWLTYRYSSNPKRKRNQWIVLFSSLLLSIFVISLSISALVLEWKLPQIAQMSIAQIVPIITTFAFFPQVLKAIDSKDYSGMSASMVWTFILANVFWTLYWVFFIINAGIAPQLISALIWQVLSLLLYSLLLIKMMHQAKLNKINNTNENVAENKYV